MKDSKSNSVVRILCLSWFFFTGFSPKDWFPVPVYGSPLYNLQSPWCSRFATILEAVVNERVHHSSGDGRRGTSQKRICVGRWYTSRQIQQSGGWCALHTTQVTDIELGLSHRDQRCLISAASWLSWASTGNTCLCQQQEAFPMNRWFHKRTNATWLLAHL